MAGKFDLHGELVGPFGRAAELDDSFTVLHSLSRDFTVQCPSVDIEISTLGTLNLVPRMLPKLVISSRYRGLSGHFYNCTTPLGNSTRVKIATEPRLRSEREILNMINHPNVEQASVCLFGPKCADGGPLVHAVFLTAVSHRLEDHIVSSVKMGASLLKQLLGVVVHMSKLGVAHLHIDPRVIFLNHEGRLILTDFTHAQKFDEIIPRDSHMVWDWYNTFGHPSLKLAEKGVRVRVNETLDRYSVGRIAQFIISQLKLAEDANPDVNVDYFMRWIQKVATFSNIRDTKEGKCLDSLSESRGPLKTLGRKATQ
nr:putative serine/threonine kinase [Salmonid herpesvirus 1]